MHFQYCMIFVLGGLSPLLKHLKGDLAPLAPPVPPPLIRTPCRTELVLAICLDWLGVENITEIGGLL